MSFDSFVIGDFGVPKVRFEYVNWWSGQVFTIQRVEVDTMLRDRRRERCLCARTPRERNGLANGAARSILQRVLPRGLCYQMSGCVVSEPFYVLGDGLQPRHVLRPPFA